MAARGRTARKGSAGQRHDLAALVAGGITILTALSLFSYRWDQTTHGADPPSADNWIGPVGAHLSYWLIFLLGIGAVAVPVFLGFLAVSLAVPGLRRLKTWLQLSILFLSALVLVQMHPGWVNALVRRWDPAFEPCGVVGAFLADGVLVRFLNRPGTHLVVLTGLLGSLIALFRLHPIHGAISFGRWLGARAAIIRQSYRAKADLKRSLRRQERELERRQKKIEKKLAKESRARERKARGPTPVRKAEPAPVEIEPPVEEPVLPKPEPPPKAASAPAGKKRAPAKKKPAAPPPAGAVPVPAPAEAGEKDGEKVYRLPDLSLLEQGESGNGRGGEKDLAAQAARLEQTLREFGVDAEVRNAERGPVITRFEVYPAAGVKVERISSLSNNIALSMKAASVRILAPIPGKGAVGVEIPNSSGAIVQLGEVLGSAEWKRGRAQLPLAVGKDVSGKPVIADLAAMPHLLIAGATGSGKTICVNSMLMSLLFRHTPETLRLILVDPKIVEMSGYGRIPHLVMPVMTETKKIPLALRWAIKEMESRYQILARVGVRNIAAFNARSVRNDPRPEPDDDRPPIPRILPYIVIVIDELADIMQTSRPEVEGMIARLAQLSRAVGIHMIIATQRPSVDVLTGVIKANFPARIAFQVASKVDSRTILDASGAEKLLGRGDLLFLPPGGSKLIRAQGGFCSDAEIHRVVEFWAAQGEPEYVPQAVKSIEQPVAEVSDADQELIERALEVIRQSKRASVSLLQRRLRIGYTRAARVMDALEQRGIVGPGKGAEPRDILIDLDGDVPGGPDL